MRFAHIADTHIRNLKYHKEYRVVFNQLYETLKKEKIDYIIHCGDIAHTKTQISPEFVDMCTSFFKNLADIAPTYIILGNHDGNLRNSSRLDALTPIAEALQHPQLFLLADSVQVDLKNDFSLNVLSVFDKDNWKKPANSDSVNIALYHGSISNCKTDIGWVMQHGENEISIFDDFDYGFLGDIHKTNQILDEAGKIRYPGSTVQQNHGETNDKGYLIWDIQDKDNYECKHVVLKNPKPFVTIELTPKGRMPKNFKVQAGARVRLVSNTNLSLDVVRRAIDIAKHKFKPEAITYLNRADGSNGVEGLAKNMQQDNLRDVGVQEKFIAEYLKDYEVSEELLERVYKLNNKYNTLAEQQEDVSRNVNWKLRSVKWDNLFNYGESNKVDFSELGGIVGIFGKNFSGKSSIIDSILYTLYNTTSKNNRKNLNVINQNKDYCSGEVHIDIGHNTYIIKRRSEKYNKKLKGEVTLEAKTELDFMKKDNATGIEESLNGVSRNETDKNIRKFFGTYDDFILTSMASQLDSLSFIGEGSTKRKEILAKFLDLEIFEKKFKLAKEDASDMRGALKRLENREYKDEIKTLNDNLARDEVRLSVKKRECEGLNSTIEAYKLEFGSIEEKISSIPADVINIDQVISKLKTVKEARDVAVKENVAYVEKTKHHGELFDKLEKFIESFDKDSFKTKIDLGEKYQKQIDEAHNQIKVFEMKHENHKKKINILNQVPCGDNFPQCHFIKDAHEAKGGLTGIASNLKDLRKSADKTNKVLDGLEVDKASEYLNKYDKVFQKKINTQEKINELNLKIEKNKTLLLRLKSMQSELLLEKESYDLNKDAIENLEKLLADKRELSKTINKQESQYDSCHEEVMQLYKEIGSSEQKLEQANMDYEEYLDLQNEYAAYDLFMRCMHSNGISYDVVKKRLPLINEEISKILTNIVEFEIMFENEEKKLDILIKHPKHDPRPIEMGSGAEKTIAAMALRLALLNISTLPKSDMFILDEPGTALDEENMEGFTRILDMTKTQFKTVVLISHLDSLKDSSDLQILIDKDEDGFAHVEF